VDFYTKKPTQGVVWGRKAVLSLSGPSFPKEVIPQNRLAPAIQKR
jgi:hypothetical protein